MADSEHLPVFTIGHSTRTIAEFVELLRAGEVRMVVDIRTVPRSRTNPQYNADSLPDALAAYQIAHSRIAEGRKVFHLMNEDIVSAASLTPGAVPNADGLHYPAS